MQFRKADSPIRQPNLSNSLAFPPARKALERQKKKTGQRGNAILPCL
jgi:hypothetical protein